MESKILGIIERNYGRLENLSSYEKSVFDKVLSCRTEPVPHLFTLCDRCHSVHTVYKSCKDSDNKDNKQKIRCKADLEKGSGCEGLPDLQKDEEWFVETDRRIDLR